MTLVVWIYFCLINVVILPFKTNSSPILSGGIWSIYVLLVDHSVAYIFFRTMIKFKKSAQFGNNKTKLKQRRQMILSLILIAGCTWLSLLIPLFGYQSDSMRRITYRIGFSFSPLIFWGALMLVKSVELIFLEKPEERDGFSFHTSVFYEHGSIIAPDLSKPDSCHSPQEQSFSDSRL